MVKLLFAEYLNWMKKFFNQDENKSIMVSNRICILNKKKSQP